MLGKICLVGIGPGTSEDITPRARLTINNADVIIGQHQCLTAIKTLLTRKEVVSEDCSPVERAEKAIELAVLGKNVAIVTFGDPGVYAIASTFFNILKNRALNLDVSVIPGLTAAGVASSILGAPVGHDFATISLADQAESWEKIKGRIIAAAEAGFVIVLYNPKGKVGDSRLREAAALLSNIVGLKIPVGIVSEIGKISQSTQITNLGEMMNCDVDEQSLIIVGNGTTFIAHGKMVTPRGYINGVGY